MTGTRALIAAATACAALGVAGPPAARAQGGGGSATVEGGALRVVLAVGTAAIVSYSSAGYFDADDPFGVPQPGAPAMPPPEPGYVIRSGVPVTPGVGCRFYAATQQVACRAQGVQRIEMTGGSGQVGGGPGDGEAIPVPVAVVGGPEDNTYDVRAVGQPVRMTAGDGRDRLGVQAAEVSYDGGAGDDTATVTGGTFAVVGGAGSDVLTVQSGSGTVSGGDGRDDLRAKDSSPVTVSGDGDRDRIAVSGGQATVQGGDGPDLIDVPADADRDTIDCGAGDDLVGGERRYGPNVIDPSVTGAFAYHLPLKIVAEDAYANCPTASVSTARRGTVAVHGETGVFTAIVRSSTQARARLRLCSTRQKGDCTFVADRKRLALRAGVNRVRLTVTKGLAAVFRRRYYTLHLRAVPSGGTDATAYIDAARFRRVAR